MAFSECFLISEVEKISSSGLFGVEYEVTPLKPLTHPKNDVFVLLVYVIISSSILIRPYLSGNPSVNVGYFTDIVVSL